MSGPATCKGSIYLDSHCGHCELCIQSAKTIINRYKKSPLNLIENDDRLAVQRAILIFTEEFGDDALTEFLKNGEPTQ